MGYRQIYITSAKKLSFADNNLVVQKENSTLTFPIDDLDIVFIEDPLAVVTTRLLIELSKKGVAFISCGPDYLPSSICIPFNGYYKQSGMLNLQLALLQSKKNKMWETIIKAKIANQMNVLENTTNNRDAYESMSNYLKNVKFGDENNMEGVAARCYFKAMFGEDFVRFGDGPISAALNYGYSIFAGLMIRYCAFNGLNSNLGIWHNNAQNANNLPYDMLEPYRPIIDYYVYNNLERLTIPLSKEIRREMIGLINEHVMMDGKKYQISYSMSLFVNDFMNYLASGNIANVHVPMFLPSKDGNSDDD